MVIETGKDLIVLPVLKDRSIQRLVTKLNQLNLTAS